MWFYLSLLAALSSGISVVLNKKSLHKVDSSLVMWALTTFSIPFLIIPAFKDGLPHLNVTFIVATSVSILSFTLAKTLSLQALKQSLISEVLPLTYLSVFLNYIVALIALGEQLLPLHIVGLLCIVVGGYILKVREAKEGFLQPIKSLVKSKGARLYLLAICMYPISAVLDKVSMQNITPVNPYFVLLIGNIGTTILTTGYMMRKHASWHMEMRKHMGGLIVNGVVYTFVSLFYLMSIVGGEVALVSGVKKLEVLIALVIGWIFFADKPKKEVFAGSIIMLLGVIFIMLASG